MPTLSSASSRRTHVPRAPVAPTPPVGNTTRFAHEMRNITQQRTVLCLLLECIVTLCNLVTDLALLQRGTSIPLPRWILNLAVLCHTLIYFGIYVWIRFHRQSAKASCPRLVACHWITYALLLSGYVLFDLFTAPYRITNYFLTLLLLAVVPIFPLHIFLLHAAPIAIGTWIFMMYRGIDLQFFKQAVLLFFGACVLSQSQYRAALENCRMQWALKSLSELDELTQLMNRRGYTRRIDALWRIMAHQGKPLYMFMIDIDFFKAFNDAFGHLEGDQCLARVAACIQAQAHAYTDLIVRFGGEEFGVVLYGESDSAILKIAENIRQSVQSLQIRTANQEVCNVLTISLGVAHIQPQPAISPKALYLAADKALYFAKASGRNRVCTLPPSLTRR